MRDREAFVGVLRDVEQAAGFRLTVAERKVVLSALGERDPQAEVCRDRRGTRSPTPGSATPRRYP